MLAEAFLLAGMGAFLGLGLAWLGIDALRVTAPANLPRLDAIAIDPAMLAFTALAGLVAAALFGIVPARISRRPEFCCRSVKPLG